MEPVMRLLCSLLLAAALHAWDGNTARAEELSDIASTWHWGTHAIPKSATTTNRNEVFGPARRRPSTDWSVDAEEVLRPGVKLPVVIWMHGCSGVDWGTSIVRDVVLRAGYAMIEPDSFARPGRRAMCGHVKKKGTMKYRFEEVDYAVEQLRKLSWVDQSRLVLGGFSEGGVTAARYGPALFHGRIILGWVCASSDIWWVGVRGSSDTPILAIVGEDDEYYQSESKSGSHCGEHFGGRPNSRSIVIEGARHQILGFPQTRNAISEFLGSIN